MNNTNIRRILVPVDFSTTGECAIEYGAYLADLLHAKLYLLHVVEEIHKYPYEWSEGTTLTRFEEILRKKLTDKLVKYAEKLTQNHTIQVDFILETGKPSYKISETVASHGIDLIVMGTHGAHGLEEFFIGSNARKVVDLSPCPVITIREDFNEKAIKSIVLPIDDSLHSRQKTNNVLPIAKISNAVVHILGLSQSRKKTDIDKLNIKIDAIEHHLKDAGLNYTRKVVIGKNLAEEAMNYAQDVNAEMLAIMADHESDSTGMFMGAFAQQIVNHSPVPVLSIRPHKGLYEYSL
ncbi:MAG TPA: universal stress protein [Bacteroidia bacterium]|nr:universal stress protein [Bacteroidia bacterium]